MPATPTPRLGLHRPVGGDAANVPYDVGKLADELDEKAAEKPNQGSLASRGAPGNQGRFYLALDLGALFYDTGTAWVEFQAGQAVPTGSVTDFAGAVAPTGWLLCDGSAVSRSTYAALFTLIGVTHGAGDGSSTFNVPDLRGRVTVGAGKAPSLTTRPLGSTGGSETHALSAAEMPAHGHTASSASAGGHSHTATTGSTGAHTHLMTHPSGRNVSWDAFERAKTGDSAAATYDAHDVWPTAQPAGAHTHPITVSSNGDHTHPITVNNTGSGNAHPNLQPYLALNKIIKA